MNATYKVNSLNGTPFFSCAAKNLRSVFQLKNIGNPHEHQWDQQFMPSIKKFNRQSFPKVHNREENETVCSEVRFSFFQFHQFVHSTTKTFFQNGERHIINKDMNPSAIYFHTATKAVDRDAHYTLYASKDVSGQYSGNQMSGY